MGPDASIEPVEQPAPVRLARLLPDDGPASAAEVVAALGLWPRRGAGSEAAPPCPRVLLNMVSSADGRATLGGRSAALSGPADRELFHALRAPADAILVGAGTLRGERYGRLIKDASRRRERRERGLAEEPLACIVSAALDLDPAIPLLAEPAARVVVLTPSPGKLADTAARVEYLRPICDGRLDLAEALAQLSERFGVRVLLCEGGPHLGLQLLADGLLDDLFLSVSPQLAGGQGPEESLRILVGEELRPPAELRLRQVLQSDSHLFLHYTVVAPERVSRETTASSSLAR